MTLKDWVASKGRGALTRLMRTSGVAYSTIHAACAGKPIIQYDTAKKISLATDGEVSIESLCEPVRHGAAIGTGGE